MVESLNVIALISGGKDSFYSILHCIQNGHKVVALGNLYPPPQKLQAKTSTGNEEETEEEEDLNSFMYQTVGHAIIPLYEAALGIPLYRQQITGSAIQTGTSYSHATIQNPTSSQHENEDETESLIPLLRKVMTAHPEANALSTGAILSTYQRTRIESVALRLGLTPLSYLWQYPHLPPGTQSSLLNDMRAAGLDARIVKVASGGLDESFLWVNVAGEEGIGRVEKGMRRFGSGGGGALLGEGGEFETLVIDGPAGLFRGRIEVLEGEGRVVREGGGSAWLRIEDAKVVMKDNEIGKVVCRVPNILDQRFEDVLDYLKEDGEATGTLDSTNQSSLSLSFADLDLVDAKSWDLSRLTSPNNTLYWTVSGNRRDPSHTVADEANEIIFKIRELLRHSSLESSCIVSTTIILRSMEDFATVNSVIPHA
jgi:diphthine-ammonia ligase